jgi:hypothetical protein
MTLMSSISITVNIEYSLKESTYTKTAVCFVTGITPQGSFYSLSMASFKESGTI